MRNRRRIQQAQHHENKIDTLALLMSSVLGARAESSPQNPAANPRERIPFNEEWRFQPGGSRGDGRLNERTKYACLKKTVGETGFR